MRKKIKSDPIDGFVYEVHQLPASMGEDVGAQLIAMVAPMFGSFAGSGKTGEPVKSVGDFDIRSLGWKDVSEVFASNLKSTELKSIRQLMAKNTEIYGEGFGDAGAPLERCYDDHFAGRYDAMLEWFAFALEVNFKNFLSGLWTRASGKYPALRSLAKVLSNLQNTSTGESGDSLSEKSQP